MTDVSRRADQDPANATEPKRADSSLGELFSEMTSELSDLFRKEVELAKVETREEMQRSVKAIAAMAGAGIGALLFLWFASVALAEVLDQGINRALAFLIVAVLWAVIAGVLFAAGRSRLRKVQPLPETTASLKEDVEWAKTLRR